MSTSLPPTAGGESQEYGQPVASNQKERRDAAEIECTAASGEMPKERATSNK